jgi:large subunit ribosomal protein L21
MYAVIETGGKQYRVQQGDVIDVELTGQGDTVEFDRVLMIGGDGSPRIGNPTVAGARVGAAVIAEVRGPKIKVFKTKRRKGYKRLRGHRQDLLRVRIETISV